jgi:hypothetical protein
LILLGKRQSNQPISALAFVIFTVFILVNFLLYSFKFSREHELKFNIGLSKSEPRIFCIVFTAPQKFKTNQPMIVLNVWASKCDNYRFVTIIPNNTEHHFNTRFKSHEIGEPMNILQPRGWVNESYDDLTSKVLSAFGQVYEEFSPYDWYLKGTKPKKKASCFTNRIFFVKLDFISSRR